MKNKLSKILFLIVGFIFFSIYATAQTDNKSKFLLSGNILDMGGEPLIGATVGVKGTSIGASTDINGHFSIKTKVGDILVASYIGYVSKEVRVANKKDITINLENKDKSLDEVVVVGYGIQRKVTLTGAVSTVQTKALKQSAVTDLSNALVGRLPGLLARQSSGEPGADGSTLRLRGAATYSSSNNPLILVDGIPRDGFNFIEPSQVESITILKDASATAIYGVKGANGVVLVVTKRGTESNKPVININVERAARTATAKLKYMHSYDYLKVYRQGLINDGRVSEASIFTDEYISRYDRSQSQPADYKYLYPDVDWNSELLKDMSFRTNANIDVSGGTKNIKYYIAGSFLDDEGIYNHTGDAEGYNPQANEKRFNFRSNIDLKIRPWLTGEINLSTIVRRRNYPGYDVNTIFTAMRATPSWVFPVKNPDGSISQSGHSDSQPYGMLVHSGYQRYYNSYLQGTVGLTADLDKILHGLSAKVRFSYDAYNKSGFTRTKNYYSYTYMGNDKYEVYSQGDEFLGYSEATPDWYNTITPEFFLMYNKKIDANNSISSMLLYRMSDQNKRGTDAIAAMPYREQGLVGRVTYNHKDKYFAEVNFGYNGSENFAKDHRFGFFPSFSASWNVNKEEFMQGTSSWLELLKLRVSAGQVGNQDSGTRFAYQSKWNLNDGSYKFGDNYQTSVSGATISSVGNMNVTWEKATKYDVGIDLTINKGLLSFTGDIFYERRDNIYTSSSATASGLLGLSSFAKINAGIVDNKGFDFEVSHRNQLNRDFTYEVKGTYTFAKNKIKKCLEVPMPNRPWQSYTGRQISEKKAYIADGYFQSYDEIKNSADQSQFGNVQPGDIKYKDINNDKVIDSYDMAYTGKVSEATQIMGASVAAQYKNFDFTALFQGAFGRTVNTLSYSLFGTNYEFRQIFADYDNNYWTPEHRDAKYPRAMSEKNANNCAYSTAWFKSGDYVRLKNVELGYSMPKRLIQKYGISNMRIYLNGNNLLTFTGLKIFDPEEDDGSPSYPLMKTYNLGLSLTF